MSVTIPAMDENLHHQPTEDECWTKFWNVLGPAIAEAQRQGKWPADEEMLEAA